MKKKSALTLASLAVAASLAPAVLGAEFVAETSLASKYVDRGLQLGDLTWHPSLELSEANFYAGAWAALPLENKGAPDFFGDEYEFYAGYGWAVGTKLAFDAGGSFTRVPRGEDSFESYLGLVGEYGTFSPALYVFYDFDLDLFTVEASTGMAVPLQGFPFETTLRLGRVSGSDDYTYYGIDLVYPIELSPASRLALGLHYSDNDFGFGEPDGHLYGSAALNLRF